MLQNRTSLVILGCCAENHFTVVLFPRDITLITSRRALDSHWVIVMFSRPRTGQSCLRGIWAISGTQFRFWHYPVSPIPYSKLRFSIRKAVVWAESVMGCRSMRCQFCYNAQPHIGMTTVPTCTNCYPFSFRHPTRSLIFQSIHLHWEERWRESDSAWKWILFQGIIDYELYPRRQSDIISLRSVCVQQTKMLLSTVSYLITTAELCRVDTFLFPEHPISCASHFWDRELTIWNLIIDDYCMPLDLELIIFPGCAQEKTSARQRFWKKTWSVWL
jgi:hypothetical protein